MGKNNWRKVKLVELCTKIGSGATPRGGKEVYVESGVSLIRSQNIYNDRFEYSGLTYISDKHAKELDNVIVAKDDVLLNITGDSVARVHRPPIEILPARVNQHVAILRPNTEKLLPKYLFYFLVSPYMQQHMLSMANSGGTRNALTKGMIENFEIPLPPLPEQRRIAHILGTLDDKIELNRRINATLEAIVQAIFKSWFVDFDPVRAKASGHPSGLPAEIDALFPDSFEDSQLGEIPKGWEAIGLTDAAHVLSGGTPATAKQEYWNGDIDWVSAKDVSNSSQRFIIETERRISKIGLEHSSSKVIPARTTLITARGTVGNIAILGKDMAMNQTNYGLRAKDDLGNYFLFFTVSNLIGSLQAASYGTIFDTITTYTLDAAKIILPSKHVCDQFENLVTPLMDRMLGNQVQDKYLSTLRDSLLPRLMRGKTNW